jgi:hypothetical protein
MTATRRGFVPHSRRAEDALPAALVSEGRVAGSGFERMVELMVDRRAVDLVLAPATVVLAVLGWLGPDSGL